MHTDSMLVLHHCCARGCTVTPRGKNWVYCRIREEVQEEELIHTHMQNERLTVMSAKVMAPTCFQMKSVEYPRELHLSLCPHSHIFSSLSPMYKLDPHIQMVSF